MKRKIICIGIVSIFVLMGFTATGQTLTDETNNDNNSPVIKYLTFEDLGTKPQWNYFKIIAADCDGDAIRFGIDEDKDKEVDIWTEYYSDHTKLGVKEDLKEGIWFNGDVLIVVEDEHGAQSEWVNPSENPISKSIQENPLANLLEKNLNLFPLLKIFLQRFIGLQ